MRRYQSHNFKNKENIIMKKILAAILCAATMISAAAVSASAITKSDKPITGGSTVFTQKEIIYEGEPTAASKWSNAFCNEDWTGCRWTAATEDGIAVAKVTPVAGKTKFYMDFNYYQWNNDKYYPSLDGKEYKFLKVKYKLNDAAAKMAKVESTFWASQDSPELGKTLAAAQKTYTMPVEANKWVTVVIPLSDLKFDKSAAAWSDATVRQFRYYPFGNANAVVDGAACCIEYMAFFKTEAEANAYKGPAAEAAAKKPASPSTADPMLITLLAAAASLGAAYTAKKRVK